MPGQMMTRARQIQKAIKLLAPSPGRRDECLRDIEHALGRVEAAASFKVMTSKSGRGGLRAYTNALRKLRAAYPNSVETGPGFRSLRSRALPVRQIISISRLN